MCAISSQRKRVIPFCSVFATILLGLLTHAVASAQPRYQFDHWTTDDGLPQNAVNAILQTRDGYLWLATFDGLVRFDGSQFTVFNKGNTKGIGANRFDLLFEDQHGDLWAMTEDSWLVKYHAGVFTTYTPNEGLPPWAIQQIEEDEEGNFQIVSREGIAKWKDGRFITSPLEEILPTSVGAKWVLGNRLAWLAAGNLYWYAHGRLTTYSIQSGLPSLNIISVGEDQHGTFWIHTRDAGLVRVKDNQFTAYQVKARPSWVQEDRKENIWLAWKGRLGQLKDGHLTRYTPSQEFLAFENTSFYEDREGSLWIGVSDGLYRAREVAISVLTKQDGLSSDNVYSIYEDRTGVLWFGTWGDGVTKFKNGCTAHYRMQEGLAGSFITTLYEDRDGYMWIGTTRKLYHLDRRILSDCSNRYLDGQLHAYPDPNGFFGEGVWVIHQDRAGCLWFGTSNGVIKYEGGSYARYTTADGLAGDDVKAILEDRDGRLWFGTWGGLSSFDGRRFTSYTEQDGLAVNHIRTLYEDADGTLWIGTYDGGLSRLKDGRFTRYTTNDGLFNNGVFQILEDQRGYFWLSCNKGIYRVKRQELNDFADGKLRAIISVAYGRDDGLLTLECNGGRQPAGWKTRDGRLWFPTAQGAAVIDPARVELNPHPPPVVIEEVRLNNEAVPPDDVIVIPPEKNNNLEIRYQGLSFIRPEQQRFKYRLAGIDDDWVEAGSRRAAYYSHLPPGKYTFTVMAANSDGVWSTLDKSIRIVVKPPFWRTWWFISSAVVCVIGLTAFAYKRRVSQLKKEKAMQEALTEQLKKEKTMQEDFSSQLIKSQESERKRIAAELHDSLGQNLLVAKNSALLGFNMAGDGSPAKNQFDQISAMTSQALEEVRRITHSLRPYHLDQLGLREALEFMIEKVTSSSEIRFTCEIDQIDGIFSKEAEMNMYRIVQEGINNIVKHSGATEAKVAVKRDGRCAQLMIEDNGCGFISELGSSTELRHRGFGLTGISERARMLGGKEVIHSVPGQGTRITISVMLPD